MNLVLDKTCRFDKPVVFDHLEASGGTLIASHVTIKRLSGGHLYIRAVKDGDKHEDGHKDKDGHDDEDKHGDGHKDKQARVLIEQGDLTSLKVDGDLTIGKTLVTNSLYVTELHMYESASLTVQGLLNVDTLSTSRCSIQAFDMSVNCARCLANTFIKVTERMEVNHLNMFYTIIETPLLRVNLMELRNKSQLRVNLELSVNAMSVEDNCTITTPDVTDSST